MAFIEEDLKTYQQNELKPSDTFKFECKMCGECCRKREEPILITGADIYRIAKSLGISMSDVIARNTTGYIGNDSHLPVLMLRERLDGSCSLMRNGRCMVHHDKPAACALLPLGRFYDFRDNKFHYFMNKLGCPNCRESDRMWTLQEWLNEFRIEEYEPLTEAWNKLIGGLVVATHKMPEKKISGRVLDVLLAALYIDYDISKPYIEQVERHMVELQDVFAKEFHIKIRFD